MRRRQLDQTSRISISALGAFKSSEEQNYDSALEEYRPGQGRKKTVIKQAMVQHPSTGPNAEW